MNLNFKISSLNLSSQQLHLNFYWIFESFEGLNRSSKENLRWFSHCYEIEMQIVASSLSDSVSSFWLVMRISSIKGGMRPLKTFSTYHFHIYMSAVFHLTSQANYKGITVDCSSSSWWLAQLSNSRNLKFLTNF